MRRPPEKLWVVVCDDGGFGAVFRDPHPIPGYIGDIYDRGVDPDSIRVMSCVPEWTEANLDVTSVRYDDQFTFPPVTANADNTTTSTNADTPTPKENP